MKLEPMATCPEYRPVVLKHKHACCFLVRQVHGSAVFNCDQGIRVGIIGEYEGWAHIHQWIDPKVEKPENSWVLVPGSQGACPELAVKVSSSDFYKSWAYMPPQFTTHQTTEKPRRTREEILADLERLTKELKELP